MVDDDDGTTQDTSGSKDGAAACFGAGALVDDIAGTGGALALEQYLANAANLDFSDFSFATYKYNSTWLLDRCFFENNSAACPCRGGAISTLDVQLNISNTRVISNGAGYKGGGIHASRGNYDIHCLEKYLFVRKKAFVCFFRYWLT